MIKKRAILNAMRARARGRRYNEKTQARARARDNIISAISAVFCAIFALRICKETVDLGIKDVAERIYFDMSEGMEKVKSDLKGALEKIKGIKNIKIVALIFIIAIALVIYSSVAANKVDAKPTLQNEEETRLASILSSVDGAGEVEVMISKTSGQIVGVLVIASGANNPLVRLRLFEATSSALGVDGSLVSVMSRKN